MTNFHFEVNSTSIFSHIGTRVFLYNYQDHYQGITHSWNFGPIYASSITRRLLLTKYPELIDKVTEIDLNKWINIELNEKKIGIYAIDSNHMAGSIMVLI